MTDLQVTKTRFRGGVWEGLVRGSGEAEPSLRVTFQDAEVPGVELARQDDGTWRLRVPVPADAICDGVQTILIADAGSNAALANVTLVAGDVLTDDIRAEVDLLRAELDMLKRAFRRHCLETM